MFVRRAGAQLMAMVACHELTIWALAHDLLRRAQAEKDEEQVRKELVSPFGEELTVSASGCSQCPGRGAGPHRRGGCTRTLVPRSVTDGSHRRCLVCHGPP